MKRLKGIYLLFMAICSPFLCITSNAQDDYKYEIGGMIGTSFYMGDANKSKLYKNSKPAVGVIFRYNKDLRWSVKNNIVIGQVAGNTLDMDNKFPYNSSASFKRTFFEIGSQVEFNFFNYSDKFGYLGAKRLSPYIFTGVGLTFASGSKKFIDANIPLGIGLKYKVKERLNLGFEFSFRKLFSDSFDVTSKNEKWNLENPYNIGTSLFKNNDWYSLTMLSITWDFGTRVCPCLNID